MSTNPLLIVEGGGRLYGVDSTLVREIAPLGTVTRLPGAPAHVAGLLNLRGVLVTLVDLAARAGDTAPGERTEGDRAVVVLAADERLLGVVVDDVHEVERFEEGAMLPAPDDTAGGVLTGMGHFGDRVVLEVDVHELVRQTLA